MFCAYACAYAGEVVHVRTDYNNIIRYYMYVASCSIYSTVQCMQAQVVE